MIVICQKGLQNRWNLNRNTHTIMKIEKRKDGMEDKQIKREDELKEVR